LGMFSSIYYWTYNELQETSKQGNTQHNTQLK